MLLYNPAKKEVIKMDRLDYLKELRKEKILLELSKEIDNLENEIEHQKLLNLKTKAIRTIKISKNKIRRYTPYIMALMITTEGCKLISGGYPFKRDNYHKEYSKVMTEIDNDNNITERKQYKNFDNDYDRIIIYSNWNKEENKYKRDLEVYEIDNIKLDDIKKYLTLTKEDLKEILDYPLFQTTEYTDKITNQELTSTPEIKAITFREDKKDYILKKESIIENIFVSIIYIFILTAAEFGVLLYRGIYSKFNYKERIARIKDLYPYIDKEKTIKKLEIRRQNYDRLTRK